MPNEVKLITNVGYYAGYNGKGLLYVIQDTISKQHAFMVQHLDGGVTTARYYKRSSIEAGIQSGDVIIANNVNIGIMLDSVEPAFVTPSADPFKVIPSVTNLGTAPRLYNLEPAFSIKGEGILTTEIEKIQTAGNLRVDGETTTTTGTPTGAMGGLIPTDFGALFTNPIKFVQDNIMFVALVLAVIYFVRRKKKKPLWLI